MVLGHPHAVLVFAGSYLLLGVMSLGIAVPPSQSALLNPVLVLAIGAGVIVLGGVVSGPHVPFPVASHALLVNSLAAVSEEAFFRRFLYGRLARHGAAAAIVVTGILFAAIHVPAYGMAAFWVDAGAALLLSWQRWASGRWTVPAATHVLANLLAVM
jgi:membrane protease YdiL (CAAX protease family)